MECEISPLTVSLEEAGWDLTLKLDEEKAQGSWMGIKPPICPCILNPMLGGVLTFQGEGGELTSSAYFLHRAASFSSGVLSVFNVCISNVISFPAKYREQRHVPRTPFLGSAFQAWAHTLPPWDSPPTSIADICLLNWLPSLLVCVLPEGWDQLNSAYHRSPLLPLVPITEDMLTKHMKWMTESLWNLPGEHQKWEGKKNTTASSANSFTKCPTCEFTTTVQCKEGPSIRERMQKGVSLL